MSKNGKKRKRQAKPESRKPGSRITAKARAKERLKAEAKAQAKKDAAFNIDAPGPKVEIEGKEVILPPLIESVETMFHTHTRRETVRILSERYYCSIKTVDRCLSVITAEFEKRAEQDRNKRIARTYAHLEEIRRRALKKDKLNAAVQAIDKTHKLAGDYRPRPDAAGDRPFDELMAEADSLREASLAEPGKR